VLNDGVYSPILDSCLGVVILCVLKNFSLFTEHLPFNGCVLTSHTVIHELLCSWSKKKARNRVVHGPWSDCGRLVTAASSFFLDCVAKINLNFL